MNFLGPALPRTEQNGTEISTPSKRSRSKYGLVCVLCVCVVCVCSGWNMTCFSAAHGQVFEPTGWESFGLRAPHSSEPQRFPLGDEDCDSQAGGGGGGNRGASVPGAHWTCAYGCQVMINPGRPCGCETGALAVPRCPADCTGLACRGSERH